MAAAKRFPTGPPIISNGPRFGVGLFDMGLDLTSIQPQDKAPLRSLIRVAANAIPNRFRAMVAIEPVGVDESLVAPDLHGGPARLACCAKGLEKELGADAPVSDSRPDI